MKQFIKDMLVSAVNGFWGKFLIVIATVIGVQTFAGILPSKGDKLADGKDGILNMLADSLGGIFALLTMIVVMGYWLLMAKMQAGINKANNRDKTEIRKLELKKEIRELELQKENLRMSPKNDENQQ